MSVYVNASIAAIKQDRSIRRGTAPCGVNVVILNLMPAKVTTELQLLRCLRHDQIDVNVTFLHTQTYQSKNTDPLYLRNHYACFEDLEGDYDALIVTGAPIEQFEFESSSYWPELVRIFDWAKDHVRSSLFICWGAQAALYHYYGIEKKQRAQKLFGLFAHDIINDHPLVAGIEQPIWIPHSRHTTLGPVGEDVKVVLASQTGGPSLLVDDKNLYVTGHHEYDMETLMVEYHRDLSRNVAIHYPENYHYETLVLSQRTTVKLYDNWLRQLTGSLLAPKE